MSAEQIGRDAQEAWDRLVADLAADGYEVVPTGTQAQLDTLRNAIEVHREANTSNCNDLSCEQGCGHDLRLYAALTADTPETLADIFTEPPDEELLARYKADRAATDALFRGEFSVPEAEFVEVDYWCHFDDKGRAIRVHDASTVHMDGCTRMYVRKEVTDD